MSIFKISEIKLMIALSLPLIAAFLAQKGMQLIDTLMMGWIGPEALAAGALGVSTYMTVLVFCRGELSAVGIAIAQTRSIGEKEDIHSLIQHGLYLTLFLCLPCMLLIWLFPHFLLLAGENPAVIVKTKLLLNGLLWGFPGILLFFLFREIISAFALPRIIMFVSLLSIPLTFCANYVLIYGKFGLPKLGIAGIGYAGSIIMWVMFLLLFLYTKQHYQLKQFVTFKFIKYEANKIITLFKVGTPSGIIFVLDSGIFLISAIMMGYFGVNSLASYQIAMQCASIAYNIPLAISVVTGLLVGQSVSAKDLSQITRYSYLGFGMALVTSLLIVLLFIITPETLVRLFVNVQDSSFAEINQLAKSFLTVAALFLCFDAIQAVATGILKGFNDTFIPMLIFIVCYCFIGLGSVYYLAFYLKIGALGIWYGLTIGIFSVGVILSLRFLQRLKIEKARNI